MKSTSCDTPVLWKGMSWGQAFSGQNVNQEPLLPGEAMAGWMFPFRNLGGIFTKCNVKTMLQAKNVLRISFS